MRRSLWTFVLLLLTTAGIYAGSMSGEAAIEKIGCWQGPELSGYYMSYCQTRSYADFEHAAAWFDLEPGLAEHVSAAKVIAVGTSRIQIALSLGGAPDWFVQRAIPFYMLGFGYDERSGFTAAVMKRLKAHPSMLVIDAWPFLSGGQSNVAAAVELGETARSRALDMQRFQDWHLKVCRYMPNVCGITLAHYRSIADGRWVFPDHPERIVFGRDFIPSDKNPRPIEFGPPTAPAVLSAFARSAQDFILETGVPKTCVVLTMTPTSHQDPSMAQLLAEKLGIRWVVPQLPDMETFDGTHLTPHSAKLWTASFLRGMEPILKDCGGTK